jgi:hypothetical protein
MLGIPNRWGIAASASELGAVSVSGWANGRVLVRYGVRVESEQRVELQPRQWQPEQRQ